MCHRHRVIPFAHKQVIMAAGVITGVVPGLHTEPRLVVGHTLVEASVETVEGRFVHPRSEKLNILYIMGYLQGYIH